MLLNKQSLLSVISLLFSVSLLFFPLPVRSFDALTMISATLLQDGVSVRVVMSEDINGSTLGKTDFSVDGVNPDQVDEIEDGVIDLVFDTPFVENPASVLVYGDGTLDALPNGLKSLNGVWTVEHSIDIQTDKEGSFSDEGSSSGTIVDYAMETDEVWDLSGSPYIVSGFTIPKDLTLTIEAGVTVVVEEDNPIVVKGSFVTEGIESNRILITSINDFLVNSPEPLKGEWNGILFEENSYGKFLYTDVNYGKGIKNNGGHIVVEYSSIVNHEGNCFYQKTGTLDIKSSKIGYSSFYGIQIEEGDIFLLDSEIYENISGVTIRGKGEARVGNVHFEGNSDTAIDIELSTSRSFSHFNNSVIGGVHRGILISDSSTEFYDSFVFKKDLPYFIRNLKIGEGKILDIEPGVVVKFLEEGILKVEGTLNILGTENDKVYLTSIFDDSVNGDSNGDGSDTSPSPGDWFGIEFGEDSVGNISNADISYGGRQISFSGSGANIFNDGGDILLDKTTLANSWFSNIRQDTGSFEVKSSILKQTKENIVLYGGLFLIEQSVLFPGEFITINNQSGGSSVVAVNNYWNGSSGPLHQTLNPSGLNGEVTDGVSFVPWLEEEPVLENQSDQDTGGSGDGVDTGGDSGVATSTNECTGTCYSNVLFLPGIMGSRLYSVDEKLWEPFSNSDVEELALGVGGLSIRDDIYAKDVIDEIHGLLGNIYKSFLADLELWKTEEDLIEDYSAIPYDWRVSLEDLLSFGTETVEGIYYSGSNAATSTPYIFQELKRLSGNSRTGKVTIITHSNGGLLAKWLLKKLEETGDPLLDVIDKVVFVGVPQIGTPQTIGALLHGYDMGLPNDLFSFILSNGTARTFTSNLPSTYHLLPSANYFDGAGVNVSQPLIIFDDGPLTDNFISSYGYGISNATELHNFLLGAEGRVNPNEEDLINPINVDNSLLLYGESTQESLNNLVVPESIEIHQFAGWGAPTLANIKYTTGLECVVATLCLISKEKLSYTPGIVFDGDGTVVVPSALAMSDSASSTYRWWLNLEELSTWNKKWSHKDLFELDELREFIRDRIIIGDTTSSVRGIHTNEPEAKFDHRLNFILHSPLSLVVIDRDGGEVSSEDQSIDGGYYRRYGEVQFASVPADSKSTVFLEGEADGSFTFEISEVSNGEIIDEISFVSIPNKKETLATISFEDGSVESASSLYVDEDGDGKSDFLLDPNSQSNVINYQDAQTVTSENIGVNSVSGLDIDSGKGNEELSKEDERRLLKQIQELAQVLNKLLLEKQSKQQVAGIYFEKSVPKQNRYSNSQNTEVRQQKNLLHRVEDVRLTIRNTVLNTLEAGWSFLGAFKGY